MGWSGMYCYFSLGVACYEFLFLEGGGGSLEGGFYVFYFSVF